MMAAGLGISIFELIIMFIFWGGLIALAIWLVGRLFPSVKKPEDQPNSGEK